MEGVCKHFLLLWYSEFKDEILDLSLWLRDQYYAKPNEFVKLVENLLILLLEKIWNHHEDVRLYQFK